MRRTDDFDEEFNKSCDEEKGIEAYTEEKSHEFESFDEDGFTSYQNSYENKREEARYDELFDRSKPRTVGWSIASMVLGIFSVIFCCLGWAGLIVGVVAVALAGVSRINLGYFDGMTIAGLVLGIFGTVFGAMMLWAIIGPVSEALEQFYNELEAAGAGGYNPPASDI